jgi:hypothetical protein
MVETTLTKEMMETGATLVRKLDDRGLQPDAALWLYSSDLEQWKLVIAEGKVDKEGPKGVYREIQRIIAESTNEIGELSLDDVSLAKPDSSIIALLRIAVRTGPGISGIRFKNNVINGTLIEDAYIYRLN